MPFPWPLARLRRSLALSLATAVGDWRPPVAGLANLHNDESFLRALASLATLGLIGAFLPKNKLEDKEGAIPQLLCETYPYPILSYPILAYPILSYPILA